ncbi:spermidine synthase [Qipengyuania profunda]|jgi:SAM-dependent methyltransferase|uniref:spermine/spermidine synthase domain-containing protein n=1 Tax=Qipengyuania profunda TaxID=3113984 RepID=UPI002A1884E0|nr:spermidine synthase [Qipengyuania sp. HL-TH1]WPL56167.1 spermidine synthase [Qipengyuania sp. HL-TH5]
MSTVDGTLGSKPSGYEERDDPAVVTRLLLASGLMLFVELALIRWLGSSVVHLSYFSNFVLLGSFLGIGAGFLISRKEWSIWPISLPLLAILVIGVIQFPVSIERQGSDLIYFTALEIEGPPAWLALPVVFGLVAVILAGPAELVGRCFPKMRPLSAYRYDLIGSLAGILGFTALSFLHAPSLVWGVVAMVPIMLLTAPNRRIISAGWGVVLLAGLAMETFTPGVSWSPYYKINAEQMEEADSGFVLIRANGVPHQLMAPAEWKLEQGERIYETPYLRLPGKLDDVLIVGAGSGSDVAIALREGAKHVDAVDIDPRIMQIGVEMNIDRPYANPGVQRHVNDGRAFLENTERKYDLILFALPDSLTLVSGASQIRLESFLFTEEAIQSVRRALKPDGAFAMYNYYREPWLIDRLAGTTQAVFGHEPCVDTWADAQAVVSIAVQVESQTCGEPWVPTTEITTVKDDAPFLYFRGNSFPPLYAFTIGAILLASLVTVRLLGGPLGTMRPYADLFFMGAAFLLLETKNIATFALLFGTTWFVNALVFAGVLVIVLAAVETERRVKTPPLKVVFIALAASLAAAWVIKPEWLLPLAFWPRLVVATVLAFLPIYLANIAFAKRFRESSDSQSAFAINLLGTIVGGCLEYAALFTGYNNLLIVTGLLYLVAFLLVPRVAGRAA